MLPRRDRYVCVRILPEIGQAPPGLLRFAASASLLLGNGEHVENHGQRSAPVQSQSNRRAGQVAQSADRLLVTAGGRVLGVTAVADDLTSAIAAAYEGVGRIHFEGMHYRTDIGRRAVEARAT